MKKTKFYYKLNNEKGLTAAEAIISIMIILITLGTISMIYVNLINNSKGIDRKTGAIRIATNIMENVEMTYYDNIESKLNVWASPENNLLSFDSENNIYRTTGNVKIFNTKVPKGYVAEISIERPIDDKYDILKNVKVVVKYKLNDIEQSVELNQIITREKIPECNSPQINDEYLEQLGLKKDNSDSILSYENPSSVVNATIICPIIHDGTSYKIITEKEQIDSTWYSYANKQWARILLLDNKEYQEYLDEKLNLNEYLTSDKSYVWIPRYGVLNEGTLEKNVYFKYGTTNFAINNSYYKPDSGNLIYNYLIEADWSSTEEISFNTNNLLGQWLKYSKIKENNNDANKLNNSKFGPIFEY